MLTFIARPWEVALPQYKALEASLVPNDQLIKLAIKLTARLANGKQYGHVAAFLYGTWARRVGRDAVVAHWLQYDQWQAEMQLALAEDEAFIPDVAPTHVAPPAPAGDSMPPDLFS